MDVDSGAMGDVGNKVRQGRVLVRHETAPPLPDPYASSLSTTPTLATISSSPFSSAVASTSRRVQLVGLATRTELNGCFGTVLRVDESTGKQVVRLDGHEEPVRVDPKHLALARMVG